MASTSKADEAPRLVVADQPRPNTIKKLSFTDELNDTSGVLVLTDFSFVLKNTVTPLV